MNPNSIKPRPIGSRNGMNSYSVDEGMTKAAWNCFHLRDEPAGRLRKFYLAPEKFSYGISFLWEWTPGCSDLSDALPDDSEEMQAGGL